MRLLSAMSRLAAYILPASAAVFLRRKDQEGKNRHPKEVHHYYDLSVKVLRARNIHGADLREFYCCSFLLFFKILFY
uniref:Secreted protein n=1 Tax=Leptobrachium leishanense TaxID=445787 RepID=A0A8C5R779_9ANUR